MIFVIVCGYLQNTGCSQSLVRVQNVNASSLIIILFPVKLVSFLVLNVLSGVRCF